MSTSGTYAFQNITGDKLLIESYERIGVPQANVVGTKIETFVRSANFVLSEWPNDRGGLGLWTVQEAMIGLIPYQNTYSLPIGFIDMLEVALRTSNRNLGGTPASSAGGTASNAFDGNSSTACTQTAPNGNISYSWATASYAISMVGVQSNVTTTYTLVFEYSNDGSTWNQVGAPVAQNYIQGQISWFSILIPTQASYFRVRETGGATLNVQELYFNTNVQDTIMSRDSRAEYVATPNKNQTGPPSLYKVNRQIRPIVNIWQTPIAPYNNLFFTYKSQIQDFGTLINTPQIPSRYLEAFVAAVAHKLAIKENIDLTKVQYLKALADESFRLAKEEDRERVPLRMYGDYLQGWAQI